MLDRFRFDTARRGRRVGRGRAGLAGRHHGRPPHRRRAGLRGRRAVATPSCPTSTASTRFAGEVFHSAQWNHDYDLTGKRVAVIGTGASAIQIVPEIAKQVGHLDVYQRTAPWVMPRHDRAYTWPEKLAFQHAAAGCSGPTAPAIYWGRECFVLGLHRQPEARPARQAGGARATSRKGDRRPGAARQGHPDLRDRLQAHPDLQRLLPRARPRQRRPGHRRHRRGDRRARVVTADGTEREVDAIVVATGFHITDLPIADHLRGRDGVTLAEHFARGTACRPTRARRSPASPTCSSSSAPTPASATRAWSS